MNNTCARSWAKARRHGLGDIERALNLVNGGVLLWLALLLLVEVALA